MTTTLSERIETGDVIEIAPRRRSDFGPGAAGHRGRRHPRRLRRQRRRSSSVAATSSTTACSTPPSDLQRPSLSGGRRLAVDDDGDLQPAATTLYARSAGCRFFERLVDAFYAGVAARRCARSAVPGSARLQRRPAPADPVPRPVLGRPHDIHTTSGATQTADAPLPVSRRSVATRSLAAAHDARRPHVRRRRRARSSACSTTS